MKLVVVLSRSRSRDSLFFCRTDKKKKRKDAKGVRRKEPKKNKDQTTITLSNRVSLVHPLFFASLGLMPFALKGSGRGRSWSQCRLKSVEALHEQAGSSLAPRGTSGERARGEGNRPKKNGPLLPVPLHPRENIQHPTSNIEQPMVSNWAILGCWVLDVGCSMFPRVFMGRME